MSGPGVKRAGLAPPGRFRMPFGGLHLISVRREWLSNSVLVNPGRAAASLPSRGKRVIHRHNRHKLRQRRQKHNRNQALQMTYAVTAVTHVTMKSLLIR